MLADKPECTEITKVSKVKVEEYGKKATFVNPAKKKYQRTQIDGCCVAHETACDWFVFDPDLGGVFIELKGKDVEHALEQIVAAMALLKASRCWPMRIAGLVVCTRHPRTPSFDTRL